MTTCPWADEGPKNAKEAVERAHAEEIQRIATFLGARMSVLVFADKVIARHLANEVVKHARMPNSSGGHGALLIPRVFTRLPNQGAAVAGAVVPPTSPVEAFASVLRELKDGELLVVPHLDLLVGDAERLGREGRDITEWLYDLDGRQVLAFADRASVIPSALSARFSVRLEVSGLPRRILHSHMAQRPPDCDVHTCEAIVGPDQRALFSGFDPEDLFKQVVGLNPVRLLDAVAYAVQQARAAGATAEEPRPANDLIEAVRAFKEQGAEAFEVPRVDLDNDIGGYWKAKAQIREVLDLLDGKITLPEGVPASEVVPRGLLFYGPPGTGKTLFAKAIATALNGAIRVVSGPEVSDKYVGEGERKVRELFAQARRNAPSVLVFDEFDAIASQRTGGHDGGSRAGNAIVAQILTEMDGFRPDVQMLVVATTNQKALIDKALLRPSRFREIEIGLPEEKGARAQIAGIHAKRLAVPAKGAAYPDEVFQAVEEATRGFNGDEIGAIFRKACIDLYKDNVTATPEHLGFIIGSMCRAKDAQVSGGARAEPSIDRGGRYVPSTSTHRIAGEERRG